MTKTVISLFLTCFLSSLPAIGMAAKHYDKPQYAILQSLDKKKKTLIVRNTVYKLRQAVKIHDVESKFPSLSSMVVGREIKFRTRKNKRTGEIEISEIWVYHP